jgi:hypothetical protein
MRKMKMHLTTYQTKTPDYEALTKRAVEMKIKIEFGGGRKTKGGDSPKRSNRVKPEGDKF